MQKVERFHLAYEHLKSLGIVHKQKDVADGMGGVSASNISNVFKGNPRYLTDRFLKRFNESFGNLFNEEWLLSGEGEMCSNIEQNTKEERQIQIEAMPMNPNAILNVPLVNQYAYAGYLNGYQNETYMNTLPTIPFIADHEAMGNYIAFEVKGDSMNDGTEESYLEGDRLLCREVPQYLWAESKLHIKKWDFVIVHEDGILIKRITDHDTANHTIKVHSLNEMYPDRIIDLREVKQIFNVVEMQRPRRR